MNRRIARLTACLFLTATSPASAGPRTIHTIGADGVVSGASVAARPDGGLVIAGHFEGALELGPDRLVSAGESDAFIAQLGATGEVEWAARLGGAGLDAATAVVVDRAGNPILVGDLSGPVAAGKQRLSPRGRSDAFAASFRPDGTIRWAIAFGGPEWDATAAAALTSQGDIAVTGSTGAGEPADDGARTPDATVLVALVTAGGRLRWMRSFGGPEWDEGLAVAADRAGGVAVGGAFGDRLSLDGVSLRSAGRSDGFLVRLTSRGVVSHADRLGGAGDDAVTAVAIAADGTPALAGRFSGTIQLGEQRLVSAGDADVFIARGGAGGEPAWAIRAGGAGNDEARALCELPGGALLVAATHAPGEVVLHLAVASGALYEVARMAGSPALARGLAVTRDGTAAVAGAAGLRGFLMTTWLDVWGD